MKPASPKTKQLEISKRAAEHAQLAYSLRLKKLSWKEVARTMGRSVDAVMSLAQRHMRATGKTLPKRVINYSDPHTVNLARLGKLQQQKRAHEYLEKGKTWRQIAALLDTSPAGAKAMANAYSVEKMRAVAVREKELVDKKAAQIQREKTALKRRRKAYELHAKGKSWLEVGHALDTNGVGAAHMARAFENA